MNGMTREDLEILLKVREPFCLSLLTPNRSLLPLNLRFKHLIQRASVALKQAGMPAGEIQRRLERVKGLLQEHTAGFHPRESLALFASSGLAKACSVTDSQEELVLVSRGFYLKPFFRLWQEEKFYLLAFSAKRVRFFHGQDPGLLSLELPRPPKSLSQILSAYDPASLAGHHTVSRPKNRSPLPSRPCQGRAGLAWGHRKKFLAEYCLELNAAVSAALKDETAPLILAAADPLYSLYREINSYRFLADQGLPGNPDKLSESDLNRQIEPLRRQLSVETRHRALRRYHALIGLQRSVSDAASVLAAVQSCQADTLFISRSDHLWGAYFPEQSGWEIHGRPLPGDMDLLERAAAKIHLTGGKVYVLEREWMPEQAMAAATLRFSTPLAGGVAETRKK